jgi:phenylacetate-CoA ligase
VQTRSTAPGGPGWTNADLEVARDQLEQTQWWTGQQLQAFQFSQLGKILPYAREHVPWYRSRYGNLPRDIPDSPEAWAALPEMNRYDLQTAGEQLLTRALPEGHAPVHKISSSGSTGTPVSAYTTMQTRFWWHAFALRSHLWHKRDLGGKLSAIRPVQKGHKADPPHGTHASTWGRTTSMYKTGPASMLDLNSRLEEQFDWLTSENPDYLVSYPSNVQALIRRFPDSGKLLPRLRELLTLSEPVSSDFRETVLSAWGVPVTDSYTSQEAGIIALQCPEHDHYHIQSENLYVEIVDEEGRLCRPGETGRVLVSTLHNLAFPLFRYDLGDYAEVGEQCKCGRGLPVLNRINGRVRNMAILPSGEQRWPHVARIYYMLHDLFGDNVPVKQLQLAQTAGDLIEVRLGGMTNVLTPTQETRLAELVREILGHPFRVGFSYPESIPKTASGKYEEFMCELQDAG